jgi:hypothetical protein
MDVYNLENCTRCKELGKCMTTRTRKLKDGTVIRDRWCEQCQFLYLNRGIATPKVDAEWEQKAKEILNKISDKYKTKFYVTR